MKTVIEPDNFVLLFSGNKIFFFCDDTVERSLKAGLKGCADWRGYNLERRRGGRRKRARVKRLFRAAASVTVLRVLGAFRPEKAPVLRVNVVSSRSLTIPQSTVFLLQCLRKKHKQQYFFFLQDNMDSIGIV